MCPWVVKAIGVRALMIALTVRASLVLYSTLSFAIRSDVGIGLSP